MTARDYNGGLFRLAQRRDFLEFAVKVISTRLATIQSCSFAANRDDCLSKYLALAAIQSLHESAKIPLVESTFQPFLRKLYCLLRGLGFPNHHLYNHDFSDFLDDYLLFQGVAERPRDPRFAWRSQSTIDQELTASDIENPERNLYLALFERFFLPDMLATDADLIGLSIPTNEQVIPALSLACLIKRARPSAHITLGGAFVSHMGPTAADTLASFSFIDSLVLHEGERPLLALVNTIEKGLPLNEVPNLVYKDDGGSVSHTHSCKPENLLSIPAPIYDDFPPVLEDSYALSVYAARGCYWARCNYCNYVVLGAEGPSKHHRNVAAVHLVNQLETLQRKYVVSNFRLVTEAYPPSLCRDVAEEVLQRRLHVTMNTWVRAEEQFTPDLCRSMADAGLVDITVGIESFCDRILDAMDKGYSGKQAVQVLNNMLNAGLNVQINIIVGYPTETRQESEYSLQVLQREIGLSRLPAISVFPFVLFDNIGVYQKRSEYGLRTVPRTVKNGTFFHKGIFVRYTPTRGMSLLEIGEMARSYATAFERAHSQPTSTTSVPHTSILSPAPDIAGVQVPADLLENRIMRHQDVWLLANFARGSFHTYNADLGKFFSWAATKSASSYGAYLRALGRLTPYSAKDCHSVLTKLIQDGIFEQLSEENPDRSVEQIAKVAT